MGRFSLFFFFSFFSFRFLLWYLIVIVIISINVTSQARTSTGAPDTGIVKEFILFVLTLNTTHSDQELPMKISRLKITKGRVRKFSRYYKAGSQKMGPRDNENEMARAEGAASQQTPVLGALKPYLKKKRSFPAGGYRKM